MLLLRLRRSISHTFRKVLSGFQALRSRRAPSGLDLRRDVVQAALLRHLEWGEAVVVAQARVRAVLDERAHHRDVALVRRLRGSKYANIKQKMPVWKARMG